MEGTVKWFNTRKGYGFVKGDDGEDYFVHYTALEKDVFLRDNDKVSFDPVEGDRGKQAQNVKLLQKGSEIEGSEQPQEESQESAPEETTNADSEEFSE
ncbi:MAG: cold-shock protein [Nanoarchaeota archaeon]|nr:cold-shock protein [Nanoarchaeota archaeon]|tara:strand:- start:553 stop:846 length:294 start_codon:yes stop_codon:yes gene_type:complete